MGETLSWAGVRRFALSATLLAGGCFASLPAQAEVHALILTIGAYQGGVPPLAGVKHDAASARVIARSLGVKDQNMTVLSDTQLTLTGLRDAFEGLVARVQPNDQVFVYYSGHGGRFALNSEERCAETLVSVDGKHLLDTEMEAYMRRIGEKAEKVIALIDSCHSGGVTTRSTGKVPFVGKYWKGMEGEACSKPVNVLTRSLRSIAKKAGSGGQNYLYVAAARDNEISLDDPSKGGLATQAWAECAKSADDRDRSGGLSADEIRACSQAWIEKYLSPYPTVKAQHISMVGNIDMVLNLREAPPPPPSPATPAMPVAPAPEPQPLPAAEPQKPIQSAEPVKPAKPTPSAAKPPTAAASVAAEKTLLDIYNRRDDRRVVTVTADKPRLRIGKDRLGLTVSSSHPGYVYLLAVGSDGEAFDMLFPNKLDAENRIEPGQKMRYPRGEWEIVVQGPPGKDRVLVMVTDAPRDFSKIGMKPAGPFSVVEASRASAGEVQRISGASALAEQAECADQVARRNLAIARQCSSAYGAALAVVEEVAQ